MRDFLTPGAADIVEAFDFLGYCPHKLTVNPGKGTEVLVKQDGVLVSGDVKGGIELQISCRAARGYRFLALLVNGEVVPNRSTDFTYRVPCDGGVPVVISSLAQGSPSISKGGKKA